MMARRRGNGEGSFVKRADGRWAATVLLPNGERKWVYGATRKEVAERMAKVVEDARRGIMPVSGLVTVGDLLDQWLTGARSTVRPSTFGSYCEIVRLHLKPELGRVRLAKLEPGHVERLLRRKLDAGLSPRRVQYIHAVLRRALGRAVRWGWIGRNVATLVDPPRVRRSEIEPLTPQEIGQLFDALEGERLRALYVLAVSTGLRQGELLGLIWGDVDLVGRRLTVARALQRVGGVPTFVEPKSARSWRTVPLPGLASAALQAHSALQASERERAGARWRGEEGLNALVFCTVEGLPLHSSTVTHQFQRILSAAGIRRRRFHDLRHSCATALAGAGVPARVVMELLGHSQISLTMNTYSHVLPDMQREAGRRMDDFLRSVQPGGHPADAPTEELLSKLLSPGRSEAVEVEREAHLTPSGEFKNGL